MKFPKNCPALMKRCCCGATEADELAEAMEKDQVSTPGSVSVVSSSSGDDSVSIEDAIPDFGPQKSIYSTVVAHSKRPKVLSLPTACPLLLKLNASHLRI